MSRYVWGKFEIEKRYVYSKVYVYSFTRENETIESKTIYEGDDTLYKRKLDSNFGVSKYHLKNGKKVFDSVTEGIAISQTAKILGLSTSGAFAYKVADALINKTTTKEELIIDFLKTGIMSPAFALGDAAIMFVNLHNLNNDFENFKDLV